ncbi:hypothetical protein VNO78_11844 [Psophocarpus tetragonolobus]|uniref:Uncharacterized protein n=1 Tax=Psophocarpus tetragonolobus TaxID=3891 RepID=A0AAN9SNY6_PSOTE
MIFLSTSKAPSILLYLSVFLFFPVINSQNDEMPIGWPFGLGFVNMRLRDAESLPAAPVEPHSMHVPSTSFSSFSSSNLDTESSASFFQDNSVSLGHLIGLRAGEKGRLYFSNTLRLEEREKKTLSKGNCSDDASKVKEVEMSRGICIPILLEALLKISKTKRSSSN